jgi:hypothetical protein
MSTAGTAGRRRPNKKVMNGFGTECSRGVDDIQIRD